jgi:hypothetical protein
VRPICSNPSRGPSQIGYTRSVAPHHFPRRAGNTLGNSPVHGVEIPHSVGQVGDAVEEMVPDEKGLDKDVVAINLAESAMGGN